MFNYFTFDGVPSTEYNCYVAQSNMFDAPKKDIKSVQVLGRNGNLHIDNNRYESFRLKLLCYIPDNMQTTIDDIRNFLLSKGTARYTEALRPNEYRNAIFIEAFEVKGSDRRGAYFNLVFDASPERYLYEGEVPVSVENINSTRTGTLISLEDTENTTSITDVKAELEPKVYHDYDSVWLPGYGKNKLKTTATEETVNGLTFSPNDDGTINVSGTSSEALTVTTDSEIYSKRVVENGYRLFDEIVGGSIVWNQLVDERQLISQGITTSFSNGVFTYSGTATSTYAVVCTAGSIGNIIKTGHIYYIGVEKSDSNITLQYRLYDGSSYTGNRNPNTIVQITTENAQYIQFRIRELTEGTAYNGTFKAQVTDLTQLFSNSSIADYIYNLEQSNSGQGVALFKKLFNLDYYSYNVGTIMSVSTNSHEMVGFNQWDEQWESGEILSTNGQNTGSTTTWRSTNYIPIFPSTEYFAYSPTAPNQYIRGRFYDANKEFIGTEPQSGSVRTGSAFVTPSNAYFMRFAPNINAIPNHDVCINISNASMNGTYEPYQKNTYSLSPLTLRGIPKLVNNKITYDGDIYKASGEVTRRYAEVDLGTLTWNYGSNNSILYATLSGLKIKSAGTASDLVCPNYVSQDVRSYANSYDDKSIWAYNNQQRIVVKDSAYTDAASFKTAMSGVKLIYELATPTTESTTPFTKPQVCEQGGTEEYIDYEVSQGNRDVSIPVGHNTFYADYVVSDEAKLTEGTYNVSNNLAVATRNGTTMKVSSSSLAFAEGEKYEFAAYVGDTVGTFEPMISTVSEAYVPYVNNGFLEEYSSASLTISPKNIYPVPNGMLYQSGVFFNCLDGVVRTSGTATTNTYMMIGEPITVKGHFKVSGGIPTGDSKLILRKVTTVSGHSTVTDIEINDTDYSLYISGIGTTTLQFKIEVAEGQGDGLVFKPMIRFTGIEDSTFETGSGEMKQILSDFGSVAYGGNYDFTTGVLTETHREVDLSSLTWTVNVLEGNYWLCQSTLPATADVTADISQHFCTGMPVEYGISSNAKVGVLTIYKSGNAQSSVIYMKLLKQDAHASVIAELLSEVYLCYKLATPVETSLTANEVTLITNIKNYIYSMYQPSDLSAMYDFHELTIVSAMPTVLTNPTEMKSSPLFIIDGAVGSRYQFNVNDCIVIVDLTNESTRRTYYYDAEIQEAYYIEDGEYKNANQLVYVSTWNYGTKEVPYLFEGKNVVRKYGDFELAVLPRWWKL